MRAGSSDRKHGRRWLPLAATPITAARIVKDITNALDLAVTAQEIHEGRSKQFPHAYIDRGGQIVIPEDEDDGDDADPAV